MENVQHYVSVLFIIIVSSERREKWKNHEFRVLRTKKTFHRKTGHGHEMYGKAFSPYNIIQTQYVLLQ